MRRDLDSTIRALEKIKQVAKRGGEYWMGRDIQRTLAYAKWDKFENVIAKAKMACGSAGIDSNNHFLQTGKLVEAGSGTQVERKDYYLTRYACYLIAMNGDTSKPEIAVAQTYFAVQTRTQELQNQLMTGEQRLSGRKRVIDGNKRLCTTAKNVGVQNYAAFQAAGYQGLYRMGLADIKRIKGLSKKESLLDHAGRTELAANEFRITQTEEKLIREMVDNEKQAIETHKNVGSEIRETIKKLGGTMPEQLKLEPHIKKLKKMLKETKQELAEETSV